MWAIRRRSNRPKTEPSAKQLDGIEPIVYKRRWYILATLCLTLLGVMLANSSLNMALPAMARDLGLSQLSLTWVVNIYTLVFASLLFTAGAFGDRYGRKMAMQIGLGIFVAGSLYAGFFAQTSTELIVSRAIMGIGGALVMPTTLSIVNNTFPRKERPRAVAIWSGIAGVGMMIGSIISGVLLEHFSWHSLFYFSAIIAAIGLITNHVLAHESSDEKQTPVDWIGGLLSSVGLFGLVRGITEAPSHGILDGWVLTSIIGGVVAIGLFIYWEMRSAHPMLDMKLFRNRGFSVASVTLILAFLAMAGVFFSMSQLLQLVLGMSVLQSALAFIPLMLPMIFISPIIPMIVGRIGARVTVSIGLAITAVAFVIMATLWDSQMNYLDLCIAMIIMMLGVVAAMTPATNILIDAVPRNRSGMGSAMNDTTRELGSALGVAVLGAILSAAYTTNVADIAAKVPEAAQSAMTSSLATALAVTDSLGESGKAIASAAKDAWMSALSTASLIAAGIIFISAIIAFIALPKHTKKNSEVI